VDDVTNAVYKFGQAANTPANSAYILQLYIAGSSPRSQLAVVNVKKICTEFSQDVCDLQVIDIFQQPLLAKTEQILAVPTLIKKLPIPKRLFIGDMSDTKAIIAGLNS
jgi:circadian clock protein KaiB